MYKKKVSIYTEAGIRFFISSQIVKKNVDLAGYKFVIFCKFYKLLLKKCFMDLNLQHKLRSAMNEKIEKQKQEGRDFLAANKSKEGVQELEGGIQYEIIKEGTGVQPELSDSITAHYKGALLSGKEFDSSFKRNQPFTARLTQLIRGWQIAIPLMKEGSHWRLWIPSDLAYGDRGAGADIPGGATLLFEVELLKVNK